MSANLYAFPSLLISILLLGLLVASIEVGYRVGRTRASTCTESVKEHIHAIQSAILGLLALLLAFTFSLALQRFDSRSEAVVDESNAIGTAFLRADLLSSPFRDEARLAIGSYLDIRIGEAQVQLSDQAARKAANEAAGAAQLTIWNIGMRASTADNASRSTLLFVQAVNELIDSFGRRSAALDRHVPELVTLLLFATFLLAGAVMGYAAGVAAHRPSLAAYVLVGLMVVLVFVVLDLDRPRRGVIQVSHTSLVDLQATLHRELRVGQAPARADLPK
jgi:uncharacterized membrane protein (Fun14 family)